MIKEIITVVNISEKNKQVSYTGSKHFDGTHIDNFPHYPSIGEKFVLLIVAGDIPSLKVAEILALVATSVAIGEDLIGIVELTVGAVVSSAAPVVKLHV